jgi:hypothetical protein
VDREFHGASVRVADGLGADRTAAPLLHGSYLFTLLFFSGSVHLREVCKLVLFLL